ncbi:MerR family transcriptional regulator, partial [Streptomyces sp. NPDC056491]
DAMALLFTELISSHISADALTRLRPLAKSVVEAELTMAMDRLLAPGGGAAPESGSGSGPGPESGAGQTPSS